MIEYLFEINKMSLALELAALFILATIHFLTSGHSRIFIAFPLVAPLMCATSLLHLGIEFASRMLWSSESTLALGSAIWYLGFALTDFLFVVVTVLVCRKYSLKRDSLSVFILIAFFMMGFIQVTRYCDRYIIQTNALGDFYTYSILILNLMTTVGTSLFALKFLAIALFIKNSKGVQVTKGAL